MEEIKKSEEDKNKPPEQINQAVVENTSSTEIEIENINQDQNNMEVHHHPDLHHKRKKFREYFIEFIMIFLAVTLGFFAESYRESRVDRSKEFEYVKSMMEDALRDSANFQQAITLNQNRINKLDTLRKLCFNYNMDGSNDFSIYRLFRASLRHPDLASPTERTMTQLKNAGGMRLILKNAVSDSIIQYDDFAKKLNDQKLAYEQFLSNLINQSFTLVNYEYYDLDSVKTNPTNAFDSHELPKLINPDKRKLIEFGNKATFYRAVVIYYMVKLVEGKQHATDLIKTLRKEYELE
ncbi:MAG: hypothetical protein NTW54_07270 [Bacteroidetes bacterium]|nr:hypothetical protein [Bacteroidota bacterium]